MGSEENNLSAVNESQGSGAGTSAEQKFPNSAGGSASVKDEGDVATPGVATQTQELSSVDLSSKLPTNSGKTPTKSGFWGSVGENLQIVFIALCLALLIRTFMAEPRYIPSDSMLPTLQVGDRVVVEKISYRFRPPATGDIVVFDPPYRLQTQGYAKDQAFIKRVIGVAGKTVTIHNGKVYLNNQPLEEDYIAESPDYQWGPEVVPEDQLFVMGDNRNNSNDSHVWGFLPKQNIIGHAFFRFWPLNRIGWV